jgi:hypothetical protein
VIEVDDPLICELRHMIARRRDAIMRDRETFKRDASRFVIAEIAEREKVGLPDDFAPWPRGIVVPSNYLLDAAKRLPVGPRGEDWNNGDAHGRRNAGFFSKWLHNGGMLRVRGCYRFWTVEGTIEDTVSQTLVYPFGALPFFSRAYMEAMRLAEYCHLCLQGPALTLRWVSSDVLEFFGLPEGTSFSLSRDARQLILDAAVGRDPLRSHQSVLRS